MSAELIERINRVQFTPVRLREGYDMGEVDQFLDHLVSVVVSGTPLRPLVDAVQFTPVRLREGYDMGEVDDFLGELATVSIPPVDAPVEPPPLASTQTAHGPSFPVEGPPTPSVVEEQQGFVARLFGRK